MICVGAEGKDRGVIIRNETGPQILMYMKNKLPGEFVKMQIPWPNGLGIRFRRTSESTFLKRPSADFSADDLGTSF